jgi:5-methylcytosine-specific restriction endonuclease McrA
MILNGRRLLEFLPLEELYTVYEYHERLEVFAKKGLYCATCPRKGTLLIITEERTNKHGHIGLQHVDIYTDDFILMTVDHIEPYSVSQDNTLNNKQPMCEPCNHSKGSKQITNEELAFNRKNARPVLAGIEIIRQLVPNVHRLTRE